MNLIRDANLTQKPEAAPEAAGLLAVGVVKSAMVHRQLKDRTGTLAVVQLDTSANGASRKDSCPQLSSKS